MGWTTYALGHIGQHGNLENIALLDACSRTASAHSPTTLSAWVCACVCVPDVVVPGKIGMRLADSGLAVRQLSSSWPAVSCRLNISSDIVSYHACMCDRVFNFGIRTRPSINLNPFCVLHERREDHLR